MMASPLAGRAAPTCLACLRNLSISPASSTGTAFTALSQVRRKTNRAYGKDPVVRLLKDVRGYGKQGAIMRANRLQMRNHLFPRSKAAYVTWREFKKLGLKEENLSQRDRTFGMEQAVVEDLVVDDAVEAVAGEAAGNEDIFEELQEEPLALPPADLDTITPQRASELIQTLIPDTLTFQRHLIHTPTPTPTPAAPEPEPEPEKPSPALSPMQRRRQRMREEAERAEQEEQKQQATPAALAVVEEQRKIHGSVSQQNVATLLREMMMLDPEAARIQVQPQDVTFLGEGEGVDKVDKIGTYEVEIRPHVGKAEVKPVKRTVEVVPSEVKLLA